MCKKKLVKICMFTVKLVDLCFKRLCLKTLTRYLLDLDHCVNDLGNPSVETCPDQQNNKYSLCNPERLIRFLNNGLIMASVIIIIFLFGFVHPLFRHI